ncbi:hypothetical protein FC83_GL001639 [Agrilactobacillus composti DSM 18527 = JCM 14202]|uniref:Uncharacterized protein n=1 Tax=Agrilactobacillus composti DSM 18527 = JCM 14202 TaxID=1423734 RepID=X0PN73_9LACO|nr:hypothetical protein [Agrilactobacillus composti]KRM30505.1 hypothetical protein FC83_GL001639 [Agrilactobacillus composti DSM 18527 = JCM 14202]GAF39002.1 hypothetical protein JCM14202_838 [Agrilactobacillus composti DSM 18527 = JCM 14202]
MQSINSKRKKWPSLFSETPLKLTINDWIKAFSVMWLTYLLFNTKNPFANSLNVSGTTFITSATAGLQILIVLSGLIYFGLICLGVFWAVGIKGFQQLFARARFRDVWYVIGYGVLFSVFQSMGTGLSEIIPVNYNVDLVNTLQAAQLTSWSAFAFIGIHSFFYLLGNQIIAIMIFLAIYQAVHHVLPKHRRWAMFFTYLIAAILVGALSTTPANAHLARNVIAGGIAQLPLFWAYRRSRNVLVVTLAAFLINQLVIALIVWVGF